MKRDFFTCAGLLAAVGLVYAAMGQVRNDVLLERNVIPRGAAVEFVADGGCAFQAVGVATWDGGMQLNVKSEAFSFNGARCTTVRNAAKLAINAEMNVSDGGVP